MHPPTPTCTLASVQNPEDWDTYHRIRREELFEARGRIGVYDPNHPNEKLPSNLNFLLKSGGSGIGAIRLDTRPYNIAIMRQVAITKNEQSKGYGRNLQNLLRNLPEHKA